MAVITATGRDVAVLLTEETLTEGQPETPPSDASPWSLHVVPGDESTKRGRRGTEETMETVAERIRELTAVL